ncbi:MAG: RNA recognition motif domain-containing protein [Chloroflexota bacterium]
MTKKVFVGNLNYRTTEDALKQLFTQHGEVISVNIVTDRQTGRSRGFAFVEMATDEDAQAAIAALNQYSLDGRQLNVAEPRPSKPRDDQRSRERRRW